MSVNRPASLRRKNKEEDDGAQTVPTRGKEALAEKQIGGGLLLEREGVTATEGMDPMSLLKDLQSAFEYVLDGAVAGAAETATQNDDY